MLVHIQILHILIYVVILHILVYVNILHILVYVNILHIQFFVDTFVKILTTTNLLYLKYLFPKLILLAYYIVEKNIYMGFSNRFLSVK